MKTLGILQISIGSWYEGIDESILTNSDKDLLIDNSPVVMYYSEDGTPTNYAQSHTVDTWCTLAEKYTMADHLCIKMALTNILKNATGTTEQDRFNTFTEVEQEDFIKYNALTKGSVGDTIAVGFYMQEEGFDQAMATSFYGGVKLKSIECVSKSCKMRYKNKASGWYPIMFSFYDESTAFVISAEIDVYIKSYIESGLFGTMWGDVVVGLLDYFNGTGGVTNKLSDHTVLPGMVKQDAIDKLTEYFHERYTM